MQPAYFSFECSGCGPVDHLLFDASTLLERAFEGIFFIVRPQEAIPGFVVVTNPEHDDYLEDFNMPKHLNDAAEFLLEEGSAWLLWCPRCRESLE